MTVTWVPLGHLTDSWLPTIWLGAAAGPIDSPAAARLPDLKVSYRNFSESDNPPILHRKDAFIPEDHPDYPKYAKLTRQEEAAGLLNQPDIGRRDGWQAALAEAGKRLKGHRLTKI